MKFSRKNLNRRTRSTDDYKIERKIGRDGSTQWKWIENYIAVFGACKNIPVIRMTGKRELGSRWKCYITSYSLMILGYITRGWCMSECFIPELKKTNNSVNMSTAIGFSHCSHPIAHCTENWAVAQLPRIAGVHPARPRSKHSFDAGVSPRNGCSLNNLYGLTRMCHNCQISQPCFIA
jgi:hypothetical protein